MHFLIKSKNAICRTHIPWFSLKVSSFNWNLHYQTIKVPSKLIRYVCNLLYYKLNFSKYISRYFWRFNFHAVMPLWLITCNYIARSTAIIKPIILVYYMILALACGIIVAIFLRKFIGLNLFTTKDKVSERAFLTIVTQVRIIIDLSKICVLYLKFEIINI